MGLFKRLRRSPEEKAWGAIRELENALNARDADSKRSAGRQKGGPTIKTGQADAWEQWRPRLVQLGIGLVVVFGALMAVNYMTDRFRKADPFENIDQRTFDAIWGARRPADADKPPADAEASPAVDDTPPTVDNTSPVVDDTTGKPDR